MIRPCLAIAMAFGIDLSARAAELLVVSDRSCGPCILFEREVGTTYARTEEARRAPLRLLPHGKPAPAPYGFIGQAKVAPTFVLVDEGREIGRFEGYSDDELFWMRLTVLLRELDAPGRQRN